MKLSQKQTEKVITHLRVMAPNGIKCPVCGQSHWLVNDTLFQTIEFTGTHLALGAGMALVPLVMITCSNCQHTLLFNAIKLGLLDSDGNLIDECNNKEDDSK